MSQNLSSQPIAALPNILIVLAAFNGTAYLREQIQSILDQRGVQVHIVLSVDRSTDGTEALVETLVQEDHRITTLPFAQVFGGAAPNFFHLLREVDLNGYDYLAFADQDDIWLPEKLQRAHQRLTETGAAGYSSNVIAFWPSGKQVVVQKALPQKQWDFLFEGPGPGCTFVLSSALAHACQTLARQQTESLSPVVFHDWFLYAFARAKGYQWVIDPQPGMRYRQHGDNQVGVNSGLKPLLRRVAKIGNGWGFAQACLTAELVGLASDSFVSSWICGQRLGLLRLALHSAQCRRRTGDRLLFVFSCLWMALYLPSRKHRS
ncbi:glycosyltransferase [Variovorax sp. HJSM1_2]|uniref:glycosyltransferase n=1 Tax=Variovorax sp. HJSM1_2 TaxID=3366263 RepID=UPI003BC8D932